MKGASEVIAGYRRYSVSEHHKAPLLDFLLEGLRAAGCEIINSSGAAIAPFRISVRLPTGHPLGILAYAFYANTRETRNRPDDEWRLQVKYGSENQEWANHPQRIWQDPFGLYTTILIGISPEEGIFVGADPVLNDPTPFHVSKEFKQHHVDSIKATGWHVWERERRRRLKRGRIVEFEGFEVLVGGVRDNLLKYVLFEREALGEDQGPRQVLAEEFADGIPGSLVRGISLIGGVASGAQLHALEEEFDLPAKSILKLIEEAPRLKTAVRGWVAEEHLYKKLLEVPGVTDCRKLEMDGKPDFSLEFERKGPLLIECKNVGRRAYSDGRPRLELQKTRNSKNDPCNRFYRRDEFHIVAACLQPVINQWEFAATSVATLDEHRDCRGHLQHLIGVNGAWTKDLQEALSQARADFF